MRKTLLLLGLAAFTAPVAFGQSYVIQQTRNNGSAGGSDEYVLVCNTGTSGSIATYKLRGASASGTIADRVASTSATGGTTTLGTNQCFLYANTAFDDVALTGAYPKNLGGYNVVGYTTYSTGIANNGSVAFTDAANNVQGEAVQFGSGTTPAGFGTPAVVPNATSGSDTASERTGPGTYTSTGSTLPVELTSFAGSANGRTARLSWTTASETNNAGFVVERQTGETWAEASSLIAGAGTTTEARSYAFDVTGLTAGTHTFRLRQLDTDGTVHYSPTATVEIAAQDGLALTAIGARGLRVESEAAATVTVVDLLGRRVLAQRVASGTSVVALEGAASGVYVVRAESAGRVVTSRLVVR